MWISVYCNVLVLVTLYSPSVTSSSGSSYPRSASSASRTKQVNLCLISVMAQQDMLLACLLFFHLWQFSSSLLLRFVSLCNLPHRCHFYDRGCGKRGRPLCGVLPPDWMKALFSCRADGESTLSHQPNAVVYHFSLNKELHHYVFLTGVYQLQLVILQDSACL